MSLVNVQTTLKHASVLGVINILFFYRYDKLVCLVTLFFLLCPVFMSCLWHIVRYWCLFQLIVSLIPLLPLFFIYKKNNLTSKKLLIDSFGHVFFFSKFVPPLPPLHYVGWMLHLILISYQIINLLLWIANDGIIFYEQGKKIRESNNTNMEQ
jgi:hypothetical protein